MSNNLRHNQLRGGGNNLFRFLKKLHLIGDEQKYGDISLLSLFYLIFRTFFGRILYAYAYNGLILEPINKKILRPAIWRMLGCKVGKNVHIGHQVRIDFGNADKIIVADDVVISNGATILCHKRDVTNYHKDDHANRLPFVYEEVIINKGCQIGLNTTLLPGVEIGEGTIIGSCSVVTKSLPRWSVAVGNPAKVLRTVIPVE